MKDLRPSKVNQCAAAAQRSALSTQHSTLLSIWLIQVKIDRGGEGDSTWLSCYYSAPSVRTGIAITLSRFNT